MKSYITAVKVNKSSCLQDDMIFVRILRNQFLKKIRLIFDFFLNTFFIEKYAHLVGSLKSFFVP